MPLFGKFSSKKIPQRKSGIPEYEKDEDIEYKFLEDENVIKLSLGETEVIFEDGQWIPESGTDGEIHKINQTLRKQVLTLKEENNLLQLKFNILLDMLTQMTAESHLQERKIEKLKKNIK